MVTGGVVALVMLGFVAGAEPGSLEMELSLAARLIDEFEEAKALEMLDKWAARDDLTPEQFGRVQMWRGVALGNQLKDADADAAFVLARSCAPAEVIPETVSPKTKKAFQAVKAATCPRAAAPVAAPAETPPPAEPATTPSTTTTDAGGEKAAGAGPSMPFLAGGGGALGAGAGAVVLAVVLGLVGVGLLGAGSAVRAQAEAAEQASTARTQAGVAAGLGWMGVVLGALFVPVVLVGLGVAAVGAVLIPLAFVMGG